MDRYHHEGRLAAQRAFLILATQRHPGANLVGDFSPVTEAMGQLVERLTKYHKESTPSMEEFEEAQFRNGYLLERKLLTMMLSNYHNLFR